MRILFACLVLGLSFGCASDPGPVHMTEIECRLNSDCETGSYCDPVHSVCSWDCRGDVECAPGMFCDLRNGRCLREDIVPLPDFGPVLEIEAGSMEDLTVLGGSTDAEFVRFTLANRSDRSIWVPSLPTTFDPLTGFSLEGVLGEVKIRDERDRRIVMGPIDLTGALIRLENVFHDAFEIQPGEEMILAVRADVHATNRTEFDLILGTDSGALLTGLRYADTGEAVPAEHIANNFAIVRHINVQPEEMTAEMPEPGTVSVFMEGSGRRQTIDAGTALEVPLFHIVAVNTTDETVRLSDLRIRVTADDGYPWTLDGVVVLGAIDVYDSRDGSWLLAPPGASGCGGFGCTIIFDGITLAPGEMTELEVRARINAPGRTLFMAVGESFSSSSGTSEAGAIFHRIANGAGDLLSADAVVGNQPGFYYISSR